MMLEEKGTSSSLSAQRSLAQKSAGLPVYPELEVLQFPLLYLLFMHLLFELGLYLLTPMPADTHIPAYS